MLRWLPLLIQICLLIYCLTDCIQANPKQIRNLPRWAWIVLIVIFPLAGPIGYLIAGKPRAEDEFEAGYGSGPKGPDDDPDFLWKLNRDSNAQRSAPASDPVAEAPEQPEIDDLPQDDLQRWESQFHSDDESGDPPNTDPKSS